MSDLRPTGGKITLGGKEYGLLFDNLVVDGIQDHFDISFFQLNELLQNRKTLYKALHYITALMINEYIDDRETGEPHVTDQWVGRKMNPSNTSEIEKAVARTIRECLPVTGEDAPNAPSE